MQTSKHSFLRKCHINVDGQATTFVTIFAHIPQPLTPHREKMCPDHILTGCTEAEESSGVIAASGMVPRSYIQKFLSLDWLFWTDYPEKEE